MSFPSQVDIKQKEEEKEQAMKSLDLSALFKISMQLSDLTNDFEQATKEQAAYPALLEAYNKGPKRVLCNGLIKPDIVFFGENLPPAFHAACSELDQADVAIVLGTSLLVAPFSTTISKLSVLCPRLLINRYWQSISFVSPALKWCF